MVRQKIPLVRQPSRSSVKQERTREHILLAAAQAFARGGYHATTMDDIARAADFSTPSLYTYFDGKQAILEALDADTEAQVRGCFEESLPRGLSFEQEFEVLLNRLVHYVEGHRDAVGFLFASEQELMRGGMRGFAWLKEMFTRWFKAHGQRGGLGGHPAAVAAQYLTGISFAAFYRWADGEVREVPQLAAEIREIFFHGIAGGGRR
jgi:TetR/AcrR family transcriptional regulator, fatty acid metabolism regulator protein